MQLCMLPWCSEGVRGEASTVAGLSCWLNTERLAQVGLLRLLRQPSAWDTGAARSLPQQVLQAKGKGDLNKLLRGNEVWTIQ